MGRIPAYLVPIAKRITPTLKTGAEIIYKKLLEENVKNVFLYSGGSVMPLVDQFYNKKINYYVNSHEQNCGHAATGYAKSSNEVGVVITTSGPGITNMITPMLDAQNDGVPLLVLSGQVGTKFIGTGAFQEAPATDITKNVTKFSYCINNVEHLEEILDYAFETLKSGRPGVVHLDLPKNILMDSCLVPKPIKTNLFKNSLEKVDTSIRKLRDISKIQDVYKAINESVKPIFFLGKGCNHARKEILELVNKTNIPFTTTIHAKGIIDETHHNSLEWCGMHGSPSANFALQEADCIIGIGARFDDRTTGLVEKYAPCARANKKIIHVDVDTEMFNKTIKSNYHIQMDSKKFINLLDNNLSNNIPSLEWHTRLDELKLDNKFKFRIPEKEKINTPMVISKINELTLNKEEDVIFTTGVGNHQMMAYQFIHGNYPGKIHSSGSLGVMGAGLPYAIGAQIANPEKLVVDIDGDSSFLMTMSDMKTIVENELPVKIAIMNDSRQMMVNVWERLFFDERYTATINKRNPNFKEVAEGFGIKGFRCYDAKNLEETTREFLEYPGAALCEFIVEPEICLPLVGPGKALDEMIMFDEYHYGKKNINNMIDKNAIPS